MFLGYNYRIMLKSLAILAVFLAVTQAPVPVAGQTTNNSTHVSRNNKQAAKPNQGKTPPVTPPAQTQGTGEGNNKPSDDPKYDKERPIEISKLPTVTVDRDWLDYTTLGVGFVVLIVGIFGVCYAKKLWILSPIRPNPCMTMRDISKNSLITLSHRNERGLSPRPLIEVPNSLQRERAPFS
jgi:hypothetical protein